MSSTSEGTMKDGWQDKAWILLDSEEEEMIWEQFTRKFQFSPNYHDSRIGINEPDDSITFDISSYYKSQTAEPLEREVNEYLFNCFKTFIPVNKYLYALDWQHPCYKIHLTEFDVERYNTLLCTQNGLLYSTERGINYYLVPIIPDGDYSIFLTKEMTNGIFGHPWRETVCIFGKELLQEFNTAIPQLFHFPIRKGGKMIDSQKCIEK